MRQITLYFLTFWFSCINCQFFDCPRPWISEKNVCYYFQYRPLEKANAENVCVENGGFLASVHQNEYEFIRQYLKDHSVASQEWLTGGRSVGSLYEWHDGSKVENFQYFDKDYSKNSKAGDVIVMKNVGSAWKLSILQSNNKRFPFICQVVIQNANRIVIEERDFTYGSVSGLLEEQGPLFVNQPKDTSIDADFTPKQFTFNCLASGLPTPKYSWYKLVLKGSTQVFETIKLIRDYAIVGGSLVISNLDEKRDSGVYSCKAENKFGSIYSQTATLKFTTLTDFPNSPSAELSFDEYASASLSCGSQQYSGKLLYAWYKDNLYNFVKSSFKPYIFISRSGTLYFQQIFSDDAGDYVCVVTSVNEGGIFLSSGGKISKKIPVVVKQKTALETEPKIIEGFPTSFPKVPLQGQDVYIECMARGSNDFTYTWTRTDGQKLPVNSELMDYNRVLVIRTAVLSDAGQYQCRVTREEGKMASALYQLIINTKPFFTVPLEAKHMDIDSPLSWTCLSDGVPKPTIKWLKNGIELKSNTRITIDNSLLEIFKLEVGDSGMYQCAATNQHGTVYSSAQLRIISMAPTFRKSELRPTIYSTLKGNITLPCKPEAAPMATKIWNYQGRPISNDPRKEILSNGNLILKNIQKSDEGIYECTAENVFGKAKTSGKLFVVENTILNHYPEDLVTVVNRTIFLECEASHSPILDVQYDWYQNGRRIDFIDVYYVGINVITRVDPYFSLGTGTRRGALLIKDVQLFHEGRYQCVARTTSDYVFRSAYLTVKGPPSPPAGVKLIDDNFGQTYANIQFIPGSENGDSITEYIVEAVTLTKLDSDNYKVAIPYREVGRYKPSQITRLPSKNANDIVVYEAQINNLQPYTTYKFRMLAMNNIGVSIISSESKPLTTKADKPKMSPTKFGGGGGKVGTLYITWTPIPLDSLQGSKAGYIVYWRKLGNLQWNNKTVEGEKSNSFTYTVGTKNFYLPYEVKVRSKNQLGIGPDVNPVQIYSAADLPPRMPQNVHPYQYNATSLLVEWTGVEDNRETVRGKLGGYRINYWRKFEENKHLSVHMLAAGDIEKALIIGLYPNTMYTVTVQVYNSAGFGPKTSVIFQRTLRNAPLNMPTEVNVRKPQNKNGLEIIWRGISTDEDEEPLLGYMVKVWRMGESLYEADEYDAGRYSHLIIEDLPTNVEYFIRIYGYSRGGQGAMSSPATQIYLTSDCNTIITLPDKLYLFKCSGVNQNVACFGFIFFLTFLSLFIILNI